MGGRAEGQVCADPGARTHIGAREFLISEVKKGENKHKVALIFWFEGQRLKDWRYISFIFAYLKTTFLYFQIMEMED